MKTLVNLVVGIFVGISCICKAQSIASQQTQVVVPAATPYAIIAQDGNSRVWERTVYELDPTGQVVPRKHQYNELASGLNHLVNGKWLESSEQIDILPNGTAIATNGQHQAYFPGDIYEGQVELVTPDGQHLQSRPLALVYFDGTSTVVIAELTNSVGLVGNNQVIYPDAFNTFTGFKADLRYTYTKAGFSQDVILRTQPPTPESLGLNGDTARLQIMTEFYSSPQPIIASTALPIQAGVSLDDESLGFGAMQMVPGRAFLMGQNAQDAGAMVSKHWVIVNGRQVLIEEVPVNAILEGLAALPMTAMNSNSSKNIHTASKHFQLPPQRLASKNISKTLMLAKADLPAQGFILDYQTVSGTFTNYTFQGDSTYYISGSLSLFGTNTFEGGAVIKYSTNGTIQLTPGSIGNPGINWKGTAYRPVVFTAIDDDSVGDTISGSTGNPTGRYYGNPMLNLVSLTPTITGIRMSYAKTAIQIGAASANIYNAQFINGQYGFNGGGGSFNLRNALFANFITNFTASGGVTINAQNVTFNGSSCLWLTPAFNSGNTLVLSNCIFANVTNIIIGATTASGSYNGFYNSPNFGSVTVTNTFYPFQTVGAGKYYLTNGCAFTNKGSLSIDATLLASLKQKTTHPPLIYSNLVITVTNLSLQAFRDTNIANVDLGYHYDPLDYLVGGSDIYSNLTVSAGTAIAWFSSVGSIPSSGQGYGFSVEKGGNFTFQGTATAPSWMVSYHTVQEGYLTPVGYFGCIMPSTSGSGAIPQINATFTKWSVLPADGNNFRDNYANGTAAFANCEFYVGGQNPYDMSSTTYSNCLFFRTQNYYFGSLSSNPPYTTYENCTFYNGFLALNRYSGQPSSVWIIQNTAFDGTGFSIGDNYNGNTNNTKFDYNAYNTNNNSGLSYLYPYTPPPTNRLESIGAHDVFTGSYNWQDSWLGSFYQPINSLLIDKGNPRADLLGLYHFTTQTNQVKETNSIVDIGYHYVATDTFGNPLDSNGNGIPDYLEDTTGSGQSLTVSLVSPLSSAMFAEPATIPIQATVFDWRSVVTNMLFLRGGTTQIAVIPNSPFTDTWPIVAAGAYSLTAVAQDTGGISATSAPVNITVTNLCSF
jgi:archaellum component FlaF (FlaF/FlaG flagellin family)